MTEIYNGKPANQISPVPGMTPERLKRAMAIIEARDRQTEQDVEILEQFLGKGQAGGSAYENVVPVMPQRNPSYPAEFTAPIRPDVQPVVRRDMTVDGVPRHLSADMDNATRERYIAIKESQGSVVDYELINPDHDYTAFRGSDQQELIQKLQKEERDNRAKTKHHTFSTYPADHEFNRSEDTIKDKSDARIAKNETKPRKHFTRKQIGAAVLTGVVVTGGGAAAALNITGNSGSHDAAIINEAAAENIDPELIPTLTAAPLVEAFGGCMDETGGGFVLGTGSAKSETTSTWMMGMKGPTGGELEAKFGKGEIVYPKVQLESDIDYTACVVAANVANVVSLDVSNPAKPSATVKADLIDPQVRGSIDEDLTKIKRGWSSTDFEPKLTIVEELMKGGVDQGLIPTDVATNFTAAYNDAPNAGAEVLAAEKATTDTIASDGSAYSEQLKASIKQKIDSKIKEKVKQLAQDNLTTAKDITVQWTGKLKPLLVKNQPAPKADKFTVSPKSIIKDFTVNAEQAK